MTEKKDTAKVNPKAEEIKKEDQNTMALEVLRKNTADAVMVKVAHFQQAKDIRLPKDYSPENALKSAWLVLLETKDANKRPVLEVCTKESIANSLLNMVIQGLNPVKKQCAFIAYGDQLQMQREYHGTIALARRFGGIKKVSSNIIFEGDEFKYEINPKNGMKRVVVHEQEFGRIDMNKILGAYATLETEDGDSYVEIMTMAQIRQAWGQGATHGQSPAHKNFPDEMARKTVIGRACKLFISSSDDGALFEDQVISSKDPAAAAAELRMKSAETEELEIKEEFTPAEVLADKQVEKLSNIKKAKDEANAPESREEGSSGSAGDLFDKKAGQPSF